MKILVTGSKGMLGYALKRQLSQEYQFIGIDIENADITDESHIKDEIYNIKPDIIIHTAAYTNVDNSENNKELVYRINSIGTKNVAIASKLCQAKLIYISTDFIFDGLKNTPYTEEDISNPLNTYGKSKLNGENYVKDICPNYIIIRTAWLYGPGGKNFIDKILELAEQKQDLRIVNDQKGSPTYTFDLALAIDSLIKTDLVGTVNIVNSGSCTWYEFAKEAITIKNINTKIAPIKSEETINLVKRPSYSVLHTGKFQKHTNMNMRTWKNALREYLK